MVDVSSVAKAAFSDAAIACWEKTHGFKVTAKTHQTKVLKPLMRVCGLSSSKVSLTDMRIQLKSIKRTKLPTSQAEVLRMLKDQYKVPTSGLYVCGK